MKIWEDETLKREGRFKSAYVLVKQWADHATRLLYIYMPTHYDSVKSATHFVFCLCCFPAPFSPVEADGWGTRYNRSKINICLVFPPSVVNCRAAFLRVREILNGIPVIRYKLINPAKLFVSHDNVKKVLDAYYALSIYSTV